MQAVGYIAHALSLPELDITQVPRTLAAPALTALLEPNGRGLGDPFLIQAWTNPQSLGVRRELVRLVLEVFHELLWDSIEEVCPDGIPSNQI